MGIDEEDVVETNQKSVDSEKKDDIVEAAPKSQTEKDDDEDGMDVRQELVESKEKNDVIGIASNSQEKSENDEDVLETQQKSANGEENDDSKSEAKSEDDEDVMETSQNSVQSEEKNDIVEIPPKSQSKSEGDEDALETSQVQSEEKDAAPKSETKGDADDVAMETSQTSAESKENNDTNEPAPKSQTKIDDDEDVMEMNQKSVESEENDDIVEIPRKSQTKSEDEDDDIVEIAPKSPLNSSDSEDDEDDIMEIPPSNSHPKKVMDDDIIEIEEADPLGGMDDSNDLSESANSSNHSSMNSDVDSPEDFNERNEPAMYISEPKSLADLVATSSSSATVNGVNNIDTVSKDHNKEPTLVIIDTNSILAGQGPIPLQKRGISSNSTLSITNQLNSNTALRPMLRTDIVLAPPRMQMQSNTIKIPDDAFLIEAPSFIVPYVFEQAGEKLLKDHLKDISQEILKEKKEKAAENGDPEPEEESVPEKKKSEDYFESPVGKLLLNVGMNLVQEYVQVDLLKLQRRKAEKERSKNRMGTVPIQTQQSIISLKNNIEESKENNEPFRFPIKKCRWCNFKTESQLVMSTHLETPHMRNSSYRCNFCKFATKVPQEILLHMQTDHAIRPRLERAPGLHQCPHCAFEDNSKAKLTRHLIGCIKRFKLERNLEPPLDWDTPGKLPKMPKNRLLQQGSFNSASAYIAAQQQPQRNVLVHYPTMSSMGTGKYIPPGTRMTLPPLLQAPRAKPIPGLIRTTNNRSIHQPQQHQQIQMASSMVQNLPRGMIMRTASGQQIITQSTIQYPNNQILQQVVSGQMGIQGNPKAQGFLSNLGLVSSNSPSQPQRSASQQLQMQQQQQQQQARIKQNSQPSISITPLPRQSTVAPSAMASQTKPTGKTSFVICEICDGYIKDLDQLRNHMQWIHKVKIHPKMIYNKPPLNCQKCQFRFFTDQGLERHLLGSHGLVTSSMQEAANKGQDNGRCPLCGKVYQWKLLAHVAKDHNVTLKPAHLSYKCTVCTATFGMYKLFESHVYSAHSMNAKRNNNNNNPGRPVNSALQNPNRASQMQVTTRQMPSSTQNSFKPMKINDEITIIPQPMANSNPIRSKGSLTITPHMSTPPRRSLRSNDGADEGIEIIEIDESPRSSNGRKENGEFRGRLPISESTLRKRNLEISVCGTDSDNSDGDSFQRGPTTKRLRQQ